MKIRWIGKYDGTNLPVVDTKDSAKYLPEITTKSVFALVPICLAFALCAYCKYRYLGGLAFSREAWMVGLVIALIFTPIHEFLHAVCFPAKSEVFMFYTMQGLGTTSTTPMTRNRFVLVNLFPSMVLGFVPLVLFMAIPHTYALLSTMLCVFSLIHLGYGYVDYLNIIHALQIPKEAVVQICGAKIMWHIG